MQNDEKSVHSGEDLQIVNFRLRDEEFGVDVKSVREITRVTNITRIPEGPSFIQGVTNLRGQVIPVIDLSKRFNLAPQENLPESARIVVIELEDQVTGILVDEVPEVLTVSEDDVKPAPEMIHKEIKKDYVRGIVNLENRLIILLDLDKVLAPEEVEQLIKVGDVEAKV